MLRNVGGAMKEPQVPTAEAERLKALDRFRVLDSAAEASFDALAQLAAHIVGVPIALVSLVDADRQWFKARFGIELKELPRNVSFCGHVVAEGTPLIVTDAHEDERFFDNPLVTGEPRIRFYAGWPLRTDDGFILGTLCTIGHQPRSLTSQQLQMLALLGGQVVDQLEARRRRLELEEAEARNSALLDAMVEGVVMQDRGGRITSSNDAAHAILGLTVEQMTERTSIDPRWRSIRADGSPFPGAEHPAMVTLTTGQSQLGVVMGVYKPDGALTWIEINSQPLAHPGEAPWAVVTTFRDCTVERNNEAAREQLTQQQRLITTGTLAAGVGHEINNPLAYVSANVELALEELRAIGGGSPSTRIKGLVEALTDAKDGAERIRRIVRGLRSLAREEAPPVPTNVSAAVETSVHMSMHELRHKATIEVDVADLPLVTADESRLAQLLVNLLVNAGQAFTTSDPGTNHVRVEGQVRGDNVVLSVIDNGPGISREVQARIFDPFFTTKPVGQGTGLGLAICHSIVVSLGGKIECISSPGAGARFEVTLRSAATALDAQLELLAVEVRQGRVMVVDDDEAVLRAISRALGKLHRTDVFADAREAWKALEAGERYDVILCDLAMPHISGADLSRRIETIDAEQGRRLVFITGGVLDSATAAFLQASPLEQLEKPFSTEGLRMVARRYIDRANRVPTRV